MRKRAEITVGSEVNWRAKIRQELDYVAMIDAKVVQIYPESDLGEAMAVIEVAKDRTISSPKACFEVPLTELESKTWERDPEASSGKGKAVNDLEAAISLVLQRGRRVEYYQQVFTDGGSMYHVKLWRDRWTQDEVNDLKGCSLPGTLAESILKAESCFEEQP